MARNADPAAEPVRFSQKAQNIVHDPRVAISITDHRNPFVMAYVRGRVVERLEDDAAWAVMDRLSHKYVGQPYPRGVERVVFLVEPEHAWGRRTGDDVKAAQLRLFRRRMSGHPGEDE